MDFSAGITFIFSQTSKLLFSLGSHFSLTSLAAALLIATLFFTWQRVKRGRRVRAKTILRALFPKRILRSRSNEADIGYLIFNVFVFGVMFGWAVLSYQFISNGIIAGLVALFGPVSPSTLPVYVTRSVVTVMLFLAYELGYWFNHWLSHKVPLLWEFHKVHHNAEVLTPLTNFRVHPVYTWVFTNILAFSAALANGFGNYMFGETAYQYALSDTNIILVLFIHAYVHLQHSHMWISFRGVLGRVFVSPAHHQVHHSSNPKHFNKNFGSCLALWDWMFGTLYVPQKDARAPHLRIWRSARRAYGERRAGRPAAQRRRPSQAAVAEASCGYHACAGCGAQASLVNCAGAQAYRHRQRQDAEGLSLRVERGDRPRVRSRIQAAIDARANAQARRIRRQVHDRLPSRISQELVCRREAFASMVRDRRCNFFGVHASQPLSEWKRKGWIHPDDPRGWFQWYCRYYMGRRMPDEDRRQIKRWKAIRRHVRQVQKHCEPGDLLCRRRQRQALLHWAYDSRKI